MKNKKKFLVSFTSLPGGNLVDGLQAALIRLGGYFSEHFWTMKRLDLWVCRIQSNKKHLQRRENGFKNCICFVNRTEKNEQMTFYMMFVF